MMELERRETFPGLLLHLPGKRGQRALRQLRVEHLGQPFAHDRLGRQTEDRLDRRADEGEDA